MPTATKNQSTTSTETPAPVSELLAGMEVEESVGIPMRGRGYDADVLAIRAELEKCLIDGTARSFKGVSNDKKREEFARKVRSAGGMKGKEEIKVGTRHDKINDKLIWGPAEVLNRLSQKAS